MSEDIELLTTRPLNSGETLLQEKFAESIAGQSDLMDKLGQQLITLELAIPGLYATVLKLTQGDKAIATVDGWLYFTFGCWFLALALTLISLIPRNWQVDPTILKPDPTGKTKVLGVEAFFHKSALYKRRLLIPACLIFWAGIVGAVLVIF